MFAEGNAVFFLFFINSREKIEKIPFQAEGVSCKCSVFTEDKYKKKQKKNLKNAVGITSIMNFLFSTVHCHKSTFTACGADLFMFSLSFSRIL